MTAAPDNDCILAEREGPIGWLTLNRPGRLNAFNLAMWRLLPERIASLERDPEVRVVILRGAGEKAFGAGADITEFQEMRRDPATARLYDETNDLAFRAIRECSKPTIAMIRGFCVGGGCAVAICADLRVAAADARFAITPARLGLGYSFSGIEHAVRELGPAAARFLFLTARQVDGAKARELGVVQEVFEPGDLEAGVRTLAAEIAANAPLTLRAIKTCVRQSLLPSDERNLPQIDAAIRACFESEDYKEGLRAFAEKRKPRFEGK